MLVNESRYLQHRDPSSHVYRTIETELNGFKKKNKEEAQIKKKNRNIASTVKNTLENGTPKNIEDYFALKLSTDQINDDLMTVRYYYVV